MIGSRNLRYWLRSLGNTLFYRVSFVFQLFHLILGDFLNMLIILHSYPCTPSISYHLWYKVFRIEYLLLHPSIHKHLHPHIWTNQILTRSWRNSINFKIINYGFTHHWKSLPKILLQSIVNFILIEPSEFLLLTFRIIFFKKLVYILF